MDKGDRLMRCYEPEPRIPATSPRLLLEVVPPPPPEETAEGLMYCRQVDFPPIPVQIVTNLVMCEVNREEVELWATPIIFDDGAFTYCRQEPFSPTVFTVDGTFRYCSVNLSNFNRTQE
jgi:hypothetical protein